MTFVVSMPVQKALLVLKVNAASRARGQAVVAPRGGGPLVLLPCRRLSRRHICRLWIEEVEQTRVYSRSSCKAQPKENQRRMTVCRRLLQSTLLAGAYKRNWYARARVVQWCNNGKQDTDDGEGQEEERTRCTIINHPGYKMTRSQALSREVTINTTTSFFTLQSYNNKKHCRKVPRISNLP